MAKKQQSKRATPRKRNSKQRPKKRGTNKISKFDIALKKLKGMKLNQQREALKMSNDAFIRQMCTHVKRLRHAPMSLALQKRMQKQRKNLQKLVRPKTSIRIKRGMLTQRGGFLPLLMAALPAIGSLVGNIFSHAQR